MSDFPIARVIPRAPYCDPIVQIERNDDGWTGFFQIDPTLPEGEQFVRLYSLQGRQIPLAFPDLVESLERDAYFCINPMIHPGARKNPLHPVHPRPMKRADKVKYLPTAFTDCDVHHKGLTLDDGYAFVRQMQRAGTVPPVSLFCESGNGLWCLWLLREPDSPFQAPFAYPPRKELWGAIQHRLFTLFEPIGADKNAKDLARIMPVPGTLKTRNLPPPGRRVVFTAQMDANLQPFVYTLQELADALGATIERAVPKVTIDLAESTPTPRLPKVPWDGKVQKEWGKHKGGWKTERAAKANAARWQHAVEDMRTLIARRGGGFSKGQRTDGALWLALFLRYHHATPSEIRTEVYTYAHKCVPPMTDAEVEKQIERAGKLKAGRVRNATVARALCITADEAMYLDKWEAAEYYDAPPPPREPNQKEHKAARHAVIKAIVEKDGTVPTITELRLRLAQEHAIDACRGTLHADLAELGLENPRAHHRARSRKTRRGLFPE